MIHPASTTHQQLTKAEQEETGVTADYIRPGAVVVDVGIHRVGDEARCREYYGDGLQLQSLLAVLGIFAGGLLSAHFITPHLFSLFW